MKDEDISKLPYAVRKEIFECREHLQRNPPTKLSFAYDWYRANIYLPAYVTVFTAFVATVKYLKNLK